MSTINPELLDSFISDAGVYLNQIDEYLNSKPDNFIFIENVCPLESILDNIRSASDFVGLKGPTFVAVRFLTLLDQARHMQKATVSNLKEWSSPLVEALKKMLESLMVGDLPSCEMIGEELEDSWQMPFVTVANEENVSLSDELQEIFLIEAEEHYKGMQSSIETLINDPYNSYMGSKLFSHMINLKGAAAMVDQRDFSELVSLMINAQEAIEKGRFEVDEKIVEFFTSGLNLIARMIDIIREGVGNPEHLYTQFKRQAENLLPQNIIDVINGQDIPKLEETKIDEFDEGSFLIELKQYFHQEAAEHLRSLGQIIVQAEKNEDVPDLIHKLFRVIHTLKGSSATSGYQMLSDSVHVLENLLDDFRESGRKIDESFVAFLFTIERQLREMLEQLKNGNDDIEILCKAFEATTTSYIENLDQITGQVNTEVNSDIDLDFNEENSVIDRVVRVPIGRLDHLMNLVTELNSYRIRLNEISGDFSDHGKKLKWERRNLNKIVSDYQKKHQWDMPLPGLPNPADGEFSDLEFDRYSDLAIFTRNMEDVDDKISSIVKKLETMLVQFNEDSASISSLVTGIKDEMIQARMVHVEHLFKRIEFQTMRLARTLNKKIRVEIYGGQTELDKSIVDALIDPLGHLIRNCLDHGIESLEQRLKNGKKETGTIRLWATQQERSVVVQVEDDGAGIDLEKISEVALKHGIINKKELDNKTDEELLNLIFYPQVSVKNIAGPISGRGVGMDAVRHVISEMYGSIQVESHKGVGTRFIIRLPLTLAVQPILNVRCEPHSFNLPMHYVEKLVEADEIKSSENEGSCIYENEEIPMGWLARFLKLPHDEDPGRSPAVIIKNGDRKMVLMVDGISAREEVIVRPLSSLFESCVHFLGSTITPTGEVRLVLNLPFLFEMHENLPALSAPRFSPEERIKILIADDSLSVRKNIKFMLNKHGIKANTAKDGLLAWQKMHSIKPDLLIVDLEMPNLNGFELMERVRQSAEFSNLPLLVLTSRAGAKHHQKAMTSGADGFLSKPVLEREIMARVRTVLPHALRDLLDERDIDLVL